MAAKKQAERKHEVHAQLLNVELVKAKSSLRLEIFAKKEKLGELEVGRGAVYWYGANRQKSKRINWSKFAKIMDEIAYGDKS